jgi:transcriptional regulator with XRE-family HTH domain
MKLIETLKEIQKAERLSDEKFAKKLNMHRTTWIRIKNQEIGISTKALQSVINAYPGLKKEVSLFLSSDAIKSQD